MTPQVHAAKSKNASAHAQDVDAKPQPGRYSLGGGEARRVVKAEQVWRVKDIVVPPSANKTSEQESKFPRPSVPAAAPNVGTGAGTLSSPARRKVVGDEERKVMLLFF
jgi:hypothetical protein